MELAAEQGERGLSRIAARVQRDGEPLRHFLQDDRIREHLFVLPETALRRVGHGLARFEPEQLTAMRAAAVQRAAQPGDALLWIERSNRRERLGEAGHAVSASRIEEALQPGSGATLTQVEEEEEA